MTKAAAVLVVNDHNRDFAGLKYVYPVLSRRAGGVSVGINLNTNNACNWHCVYCQVPGLTRGGPLPVDLALLETELRGFLEEMVSGRFMAEHVPEGMGQVQDIALSGNGEPTSAREFPQVVDLLQRVRNDFGLVKVPLRLITNGSLLAREYVQLGVRQLGRAGGEVWFKLDGGRGNDFARINGTRLDPLAVVKRLVRSAELCPTWVQSCFFRWEGKPPSAQSLAAYLGLLEQAQPSRLAGVLLYGVARPSMQPEAGRVSPLEAGELEAIAERIRTLGLTVRVSP